MQTTWRVENSSRERFDWRGVTTNRNGPVPDCSRRLSSCFWSGAFNSHTVTEVTTDITDTPYRTGCHGAGPMLSSVCAHAFSRLSTTVGSLGSLCRQKYVWIL